jgi:internalin A
VSFDVPVGGVVSIPDANLLQAIRDALGKQEGDITTDDMLSLMSLTAAGLSIGDLTGLEFATNLTFLDLSSNTFSDFSPISDLTGLIELQLRGLNLSDLNLLSGMSNLEILNISSSIFSDLNPLSGLSGLNALSDLRALFGRIGDLTPLASLPGLTFLDVRRSRLPIYPGSPQQLIIDGLINGGVTVNFTTTVNIPDDNLFAALKSALGIPPGEPAIEPNELISLTEFSAINAGITDLTGLEFATGVLTTLDLSNNSISDLSPLSGLFGLTDLRLAQNSASDLSPLSGLWDLKILYLLANGRLKTGQIMDVGAEGIDVYNTMLQGMGVDHKLGPADRDRVSVDRIRA